MNMTLNTLEIKTLQGALVNFTVEPTRLNISYDIIFTCIPINKIEFEDKNQAISTKDGSFRMTLQGNYLAVKDFIQLNM